MGVIHLAQVDLTKRFRELGYHSQKKTTISTADILKILKEYYPEVAIKFPNLKSGDMARVVGILHLGKTKACLFSSLARQAITKYLQLDSKPLGESLGAFILCKLLLTTV